MNILYEVYESPPGDKSYQGRKIKSRVSYYEHQLRRLAANPQSDDPEDFLRMEKWIFDSPDQAGEAFRQFVKQFYQSNGFVNGGIQIGGRSVDLRRIDMPVLNIFAEQDHLVPPASSRALKDLVGGDDYSELSFKGGHIGIYVSTRAQREVPAAIHELDQRAD